jgi:hypothetical protein
MQRIWRTYIDNVNVFAINHSTPVVCCLIPTPARSHVAHGFLIAPADHFALQRVRRVEEVSNLVKGIGVGTAHEAVPDHGNV